MQEGLEMSRRLGDRPNSRSTGVPPPAGEYMGDPVEAVRYAEEALRWVDAGI